MAKRVAFSDEDFERRQALTTKKYKKRGLTSTEQDEYKQLNKKLDRYMAQPHPTQH